MNVLSEFDIRNQPKCEIHILTRTVRRSLPNPSTNELLNH